MTGVFSGASGPALTLLPALVVLIGIGLALLVARRSELLAHRVEDRRPKLAKGVITLAAAVENTKDMLRHRGSRLIVLGAVAYLGFDMAVLQGSFLAIDVHPVPRFAVISMSYLIGGLAGSIPLPANLGAITGMAGMLIAYGVDSNHAVAAVVLYQAISYLVPLIGGGIAYLLLRSELGSMSDAGAQAAPG